MRRLTIASAATIAVVVAAASTAAARAYWKPVMPAIAVEMKLGGAVITAPNLLLIYGEQGSDPFRSGTLAPDQRISNCTASGILCISRAARNEFLTDGARKQSLQVRLFNGRGNPILGAVTWSGPAFPKSVTLACDFKITDVHHTCKVSKIAV